MAMNGTERRRIGRTDDFAEGRVTLVEVDGAEVGVLRVQGQVRAFENRCPHQQGPVCLGDVLPEVEGVLDDQRRLVGERFAADRLNLICPWHGWSFDAMTGECIADRRFRLVRWEAVEDGGEVYLLRRARA